MSTGDPYGDPTPPGDRPWMRNNPTGSAGGPPGYDPPGYGPPGYAGGPYMEPHRGTLILVFGILSLVICGLLGPVAWILGRGDLAKMRAGTMDPRGESETRIGMILGMVTCGLMAFGCLAYAGFMVLIIGVGAAGR